MKMHRVNTVGKPNFFVRSFLVSKLSSIYVIDVADSGKKFRKFLEILFQPFLKVFRFIFNFSTRPKSPQHGRVRFSDREFNSASNETTLNLGNDGEKKFLCFSGQVKTGSSQNDDVIVTRYISIDVELKPESIDMTFGVTDIGDDVIITK